MKPRVRRATVMTDFSRSDSSATSMGRVLVIGSGTARCFDRGHRGETRLSQPITLACGEGDLYAEALDRLGHPSGSRGQRMIDQELHHPSREVGVAAEGRNGLDQARVDVLGKTLEHLVPRLGHPLQMACPATG